MSSRARSSCKIVMIPCDSARKFVNTAWIDQTWRFVDLAHFGFGTSLAFFFIISILFSLLISVKQQHLIIMILVMWDVQCRSSFAYYILIMIIIKNCSIWNLLSIESNWAKKHGLHWVQFVHCVHSMYKFERPDHSIHFLDITISRTDQGLNTQVHILPEKH